MPPSEDAESTASHSNANTIRYAAPPSHFLSSSTFRPRRNPTPYPALGKQKDVDDQTRDRNGEAGQERRPLLAPPALLRNRLSYTTLATRDLHTTNVWGITHRIRRDIKKCIETALTYEQINSPKLVFSVMRPLQEAYMKLNAPCTIYALLLNRVYFHSQQYTLSSLSVNSTRAMVCEVLATKLVRQLFEDDPSDDGVFRLCILLASTFSPFQGAPAWAVPEYARHEDLHPSLDKAALSSNSSSRRTSMSALELAIVSGAKRFIRAVPTQKVIDAIWTGRIVYSSISLRYLIKDQYKRRPIMKYDARHAPFLDHYRLRVPRVRAALEWTHFTVLFVAYLVVLRTMQPHRMNGFEIFWVIYGFGFGLDKFASLMELGWTVFLSNLWNGLDFVFVLMFLVYLPVRVIGLQRDHERAAQEALDILTCAGCVLFPRFAFVTLSDNLLILSLRSMLAQFTKLMVLAVWCFAGFFVAFVTLGGDKYRPGEILQWMVWIWFGLDATGMQKSTHLHNWLGPTLMVIYACLSSTLLLTVLVSILSNTFNAINSDALAEQMYRKAVSTFQGVKSDGIFSFQPPLNILALFILWPARFFMDAHHYHQLIVFCARVSNAPLLVVIRLVERYFLFADPAARSSIRSFLRLEFLHIQRSRMDLDDVFENEDDIEDDSLPVGAFQMHDGTSTPDPEREGERERERDNQREQGRSESKLRASSPAGFGAERRSSPEREDVRRERERDRKRRTMSMSEWGTSTAGHSSASTIKAKPAILSKLYGPTRDITWPWANNNKSGSDGDYEALKERLERIEEGQKRIEEALKGLGGGDGD